MCATYEQHSCKGGAGTSTRIIQCVVVTYVVSKISLMSLCSGIALTHENVSSNPLFCCTD